MALKTVDVLGQLSEGVTSLVKGFAAWMAGSWWYSRARIESCTMVRPEFEVIVKLGKWRTVLKPDKAMDMATPTRLPFKAVPILFDFKDLTEYVIEEGLEPNVQPISDKEGVLLYKLSS